MYTHGSLTPPRIGPPAACSFVATREEGRQILARCVCVPRPSHGGGHFVRPQRRARTGSRGSVSRSGDAAAPTAREERALRCEARRAPLNRQGVACQPLAGQSLNCLVVSSWCGQVRFGGRVAGGLPLLLDVRLVLSLLFARGLVRLFESFVSVLAHLQTVGLRARSLLGGLRICPLGVRLRHSLVESKRSRLRDDPGGGESVLADISRNGEQRAVRTLGGVPCSFQCHCRLRVRVNSLHDQPPHCADLLCIPDFYRWSHCRDAFRHASGREHDAWMLPSLCTNSSKEALCIVHSPGAPGRDRPTSRCERHPDGVLFSLCVCRCRRRGRSVKG